jgi:transcriptional regulator with XRE-family HTH domain
MEIREWSHAAKLAAKHVGFAGNKGLAKKTGYAAGYLSQMCSGSARTSPGAAKKLAKALNLPASEFGQVEKKAGK